MHNVSSIYISCVGDIYRLIWCHITRISLMTIPIVTHLIVMKDIFKCVIVCMSKHFVMDIPKNFVERLYVF